MPDWMTNLDWAWTIDQDWGQLPFWDLCLRLAMATLLGGLVGLERERLDRAAGLRTHALVAVASALIMIVSTYGFPLPADGTQGSLDPSRIAAQVVSGIGFLGAGVIIFRDNSIRGLTTAATLWAVAGVGLAAGGGLFAPAIVGTFFMLLVQAGFKPLEYRFFAKHARQHRVLLEVEPGYDVLAGIQFASNSAGPIRLKTMLFDRSPDGDHDTVDLTVLADSQQAVLEMVSQLRQHPSVHHISYKRASMAAGRSRPLNGHRHDNSDDDDDH